MKNAIVFFTIALMGATACQNSGTDAGFSSMETEYMDQSAKAQEDFSETGEYDFDETPPIPPSAPQPKAQNQSVPPAETPIPRQIIKTANYRIKVKDVNASSKRANELAVKQGGYVSESALTNSSYEITNAITIRVPASRFDTLLDDLGGEAIFTQYKRIASQDVTEEYVDIATRLKTKKEVRDRYVDILRNKAKTVEEVLKAEEQIRIIQEEIEAREGRLRYLKDQVAMSTIHLELYQSIEYKPEPTAFHESFWSQLLTSLKNGWQLAQGIVLFFINIWPVVILGALVWWKRRWVWSKLRRK